MRWLKIVDAHKGSEETQRHTPRVCEHIITTCVVISPTCVCVCVLIDVVPLDNTGDYQRLEYVTLTVQVDPSVGWSSRDAECWRLHSREMVQRHQTFRKRRHVSRQYHSISEREQSGSVGVTDTSNCLGRGGQVAEVCVCVCRIGYSLRQLVSWCNTHQNKSSQIL